MLGKLVGKAQWLAKRVRSCWEFSLLDDFGCEKKYALLPYEVRSKRSDRKLTSNVVHKPQEVHKSSI